MISVLHKSSNVENPGTKASRWLIHAGPSPAQIHPRSASV